MLMLADGGFDLPRDNQNRNEQECVENFFLPVVLDNFKNYDVHFVIKHIDKKYMEHRNAANEVRFGEINVIPLNSEKLVMFEIGYVRFLDSYQFLTDTLSDLVSMPLKSGRDKFVNTKTYLEDHHLVRKVFTHTYT